MIIMEKDILVATMRRGILAEAADVMAVAVPQSLRLKDVMWEKQ